MSEEKKSRQGFLKHEPASVSQVAAANLLPLFHTALVEAVLTQFGLKLGHGLSDLQNKHNQAVKDQVSFA
jgi:hypothetical protein